MLRRNMRAQRDVSNTQPIAPSLLRLQQQLLLAMPRLLLKTVMLLVSILQFNLNAELLSLLLKLKGDDALSQEIHFFLADTLALLQLKVDHKGWVLVEDGVLACMASQSEERPWQAYRSG